MMHRCTIETVGLRVQERQWELLIAQVAQGDQQALGTLYDATCSLVYGLALRMLGNTGTAEEVTLDVYTHVWQQAATYDPQRGAPSAWLFMLTRSRAIDRLRRRTQEERTMASFEHIEVPEGMVTPEESSEVAERRRLVQAAFTALPAEQREVLELAYFAGLSHHEIATQLGLALGTVKTRIRLGMTKLRESLQPLVA
jgi:RNA polymerase sigma-70 factor (ECF subfamily)